jgi:hypothetical protein
MPNSLLDVFTQALLVDRGQRLGTSFWAFRDQVCHPEPLAPGSKFSHWVAKPGAAEWVADALRDITIQYRLEEVLELPPVVEYAQSFVLSPTHRAAYEKLRAQGLLLLKDRVIGAAHAAALRQKLMQLLSGAVYDGEGVAETDKDLRDQYSELEARLIAALDQQEATQARGRSATATLNEEELATVVDWDQVHEFIRSQNAFFLLQRRINSAAWREAAAERGEPIPGTTVFKKRSIALRRI